jgi:FKBP-type peptidyl-prolyl cis-trans isomerase FkpA
MKKSFLFLMFVCCFAKNYAQKIMLPDSLKAVGFYTELVMSKPVNDCRVEFGNNIIVFLHNIKGTYFFASNKNTNTTIRNTIGQHVERNGSLEFVISSRPTFPKDKIKYYINSFKDSNSIHYAFYINNTGTNEWKYLGKLISNDTLYPNFIGLNKRRKDKTSNLQNTWIQYEGKGWKAIDTVANKIAPSFRPFRNIDSAAQHNKELKFINDSLKNTATLHNGLYYQMLQIGTGEPLQVTDTVTIHYKGWNFATNQIFDQTETKPATFPLQRLIPGWQIGMPLCKVGGKIRLFIPSPLAYGIRNLNAIITPNATLVFDIEVLSTKPKL